MEVYSEERVGRCCWCGGRVVSWWWASCSEGVGWRVEVMLSKEGGLLNGGAIDGLWAGSGG